MQEIAKALIKAQSEMSDAKKNAKNPFLKNSYADLNAIREAVIPVLNENKIAVLQPMMQINGEMYIQTLLLHESGENIESLTKVVVSKQNDAQSQGSGITYARRYGLQSLLNVGAVDDDGNKASEPQKQTMQNKPLETQNQPIKLSQKAIDEILSKGVLEVEKYIKLNSEKKVLLSAEQIETLTLALTNK
jgi:hypothetical protein